MAKHAMDYQKSGSDKMAKMKAEAKKEAEPVAEEAQEYAQPGGDTDDDGAVCMPPQHIDSLQAAVSRSGPKMHPEDHAVMQNHVHMLRGAAMGGSKKSAKVKFGGM